MMWKKGLSLFVVAGVLLVGCTNNTATNNNETPAEDVRDNARHWENDVKRDIEDGNFDDGHGNRDQTGANQTENNGNKTEMNNDNKNHQVEIIEDLDRENHVE